MNEQELFVDLVKNLIPKYRADDAIKLAHNVMKESKRYVNPSEK